jgi:hypothetical protein
VSDEKDKIKYLERGNREEVTDSYVPKDIVEESEYFKYKILIRLNAKKITFKNVSFMHCVFDGPRKSILRLHGLRGFFYEDYEKGFLFSLLGAT